MKTQRLLITLLLTTLSASAQVVTDYSGDEGAPSAQNFTLGSAGGTRTVTETNYNGKTAWITADNDTGSSGPHYSRTLDASDQTLLQQRGYRASARLAVLDGTAGFYIDDGNRRYQAYLKLESGSLTLGLLTDTLDPTFDLGTYSGAYVNIAIDVAPANSSVSLLIDGQPIDIDSWNGTASSGPRLRAGQFSNSGTGQTAWREFAIASRVPASDMSFTYLSDSDTYELDAVNNVAGHLHVPDMHNDDMNGNKSVTVIGENACSPGLAGHKDLISLHLPASLTSIGDSAFYRCNGFTGVLTLPSNLTTIASYAFFTCNGFTGALTIPDGITTIASYTFQNCSGFDGALTIPDGVTTIGDLAFIGCSGFTGALTIPDGVTTIFSSAFQSCSGFDGALTIPDSVTSIGGYAFRDCSKLTGALTIPNGITTIGNYAFYQCSGFDGALTLPAGLTTIGDYAFRSCSKLTGSLTIPDSVTSIGDGFAAGCSSLQTIEVTSNNPNYTSQDGVFFNKDRTTLLQFPAGHNDSTYAIPESVNTIAPYAFYKCSGLTGSLTIPDGVTSIGGSAFRHCSGFEGALTIPDGVTSIGDYAFSECSGFTSLTIPDSVTSIGNYAFWICIGLDEVCWLGAPPTTYGALPFLSTSATHYVPSTYLSEYQALAGLADALVKPPTLVISSSGNQWIVTYLTASGFTHQPEFSTDLVTWSQHGSPVIGNDQNTSFTINPAIADFRYFRVKTIEQN